MTTFADASLPTATVEQFDGWGEPMTGHALIAVQAAYHEAGPEEAVAIETALQQPREFSHAHEDVMTEGVAWKSALYYHLDDGGEAVVLIPKDRDKQRITLYLRSIPKEEREGEAEKLSTLLAEMI